MDLWRAPFSSADSITSLQKRLVRSLFCPAHLWDFFSLTILHLWSHASTTSRTCEVGKPSSIVTVVLCVLGSFSLDTAVQYYCYTSCGIRRPKRSAFE